MVIYQQVLFIHVYKMCNSSKRFLNSFKKSSFSFLKKRNSFPFLNFKILKTILVIVPGKAQFQELIMTFFKNLLLKSRYNHSKILLFLKLIFITSPLTPYYLLQLLTGEIVNGNTYELITVDCVLYVSFKQKTFFFKFRFVVIQYNCTNREVN